MRGVLALQRFLKAMNEVFLLQCTLPKFKNIKGTFTKNFNP